MAWHEECVCAFKVAFISDSVGSRTALKPTCLTPPTHPRVDGLVGLERSGHVQQQHYFPERLLIVSAGELMGLCR